MPNFESQRNHFEADDLGQSSIGLSSKILILSMIVHVVQVYFICSQSKAMNRKENKRKEKVRKGEESGTPLLQ